MSTTYHSDGSINGIPNGINTLIAGATAGDIITIPSGSFTWGASAAFVNITKAITLQGAGIGTTTITISSAAPSGGVIQIYAAATVKDFTLIPYATSANPAAIKMFADGWRVTGLEHNPGVVSNKMYFCKVDYGYGLIDSNTITGGDGENELILVRGPTDAWDSAYPSGSAEQVYIEGNSFLGIGYVCDANSNAFCVVRANTVGGQMKVDGHGYNTNNPVRGVRGMETYYNLWTHNAGSNWPCVEIRGGSGFLFGNNSKAVSAVLGYYRLDDYAMNTPGSTNFSGIFQTPNNWPIPDQVGAGPGTVVPNGFGTQQGGAEPYYVFLNYKNGVAASLRWDGITNQGRNTGSAGYSPGATVIAMTGGSIRTGNYVYFSGNPNVDTQRYLVTTGYSSSTGNITISPPLLVAIPASVTSATIGPLTNYQGQEASTSATFVSGPTAPCIIQNDRDFFQTITPFTGASGVGSGLLSARPASGSLAGVAYWATDQGSWNDSFSGTIAATAIQAGYICEIVSVGTTNFTLIGAPANTVGICFLATGAGTGDGTVTAPSGQLSIWDGADWNTAYTPYQYPHPLRTGTPILLAASVASTGNTITLIFSDSCTNGGGGGNGMTVTPSGGVATVSYSSGSGSNTYVYNTNRTILSGETLTISYTQPGDGIESTSAGVELASFTDFPVSNGSNISGGQASCLRNPAALGGGF